MPSPPEKVFEYFASHRNPKGEVFMTPADLMRAIVLVFPPSKSNLVREENLRGERNPGELRCTHSTFFMLFDTDGDGLISFCDYIFFVTLLSIPESSFSVVFKMFGLDNNGLLVEEIDLGDGGVRQVVSGLAKYCSPEELTNRRVALITNVKPGKLRNVSSSGLVLCASNADQTALEPLLPPEGAAIGERVSFSGHDGKPEDVLNPKKKQLEKITPICT